MNEISYFAFRVRKFYNEDPTMPIFASGRKMPMSTGEAVQLLANGKEGLNTCQKTSFFKNNAEHFVDLSKHNYWRDIKTDFTGGMKRHATKTLRFQFRDGSAISAQACNCPHIANRCIYSHNRYTL